jgi:hypothetical protein
MVTRDFVQAGKFWVKNESKALFGDPQEVHLVCENIHSAPNVYFFLGVHYFFSGLGGHDTLIPECNA